MVKEEEKGKEKEGRGGGELLREVEAFLFVYVLRNKIATHKRSVCVSVFKCIRMYGFMCVTNTER